MAKTSVVSPERVAWLVLAWSVLALGCSSGNIYNTRSKTPSGLAGETGGARDAGSRDGGGEEVGRSNMYEDAGNVGNSGGSGGRLSGNRPAGSGGQSAATGGGGRPSATGGSPSTGGKPQVAQCTTPVTGLPAGAPQLTEGVWKDITPPGLQKGAGETLIGQGVAVDPCNRAVIFWCTSPFDDSKGGLYRSLDAGSNWQRVGITDDSGRMIDEPLKVRIDPSNTQHILLGDGVRGSTMGFWISQDGGLNFHKPASWVKLAMDKKITIDDVYDIAVDPTDFDHILVSSHSPWLFDSDEYGDAAGVMETKDGGESWIAHPPIKSWGAGHSIYFLYDPKLGIGDNQTWLLGTQGDGQWRTTDGGGTWTQVSQSDIFHGGGTHYYSNDKTLYVTATPQILRSTDNGATFKAVGPSFGFTAVHGDGKHLYTAPAYSFGDQPFLSSVESDGTTWNPFAQKFSDSGPSEMAWDEVNGVLYASNWFQGVWAMKPPK